jgi:hypothetical protein
MATDLRSLLRELRDSPVTTRTTDLRLRRLRFALAGLWVVGLAVWTQTMGPPLALKTLFLWLALAMLIASVGNPLGWARSMLVDWCPLYLVLVGYDIAHGLADNLGGRPHVDPHLSFDQAIFGAQGPTEHLQSWLWQGSANWYDHAVLMLYLSHFVVSVAVCALLWMRSREGFLALRRRMLGVWFVGLVFFATYPSVPPWMAAQQGHLPEMDRIVAVLMNVVASTQTAAALEDGDGRISLANPVAAVPSMHAALPMLLLLFTWHRVQRLRVPATAYTVLMAYLLVYTGEHYLFDILAGWACALVVHLAFIRLERRKRSRRVARRTHDEAVPRPTPPSEAPSPVGSVAC